jgi:hypothetical protein
VNTVVDIENVGRFDLWSCGGRILRRAWSGCVSVFVDEAVAAG